MHSGKYRMNETLAALQEKEQARRLTEFSHRWGNESTSRFFALNDFLTVKFLDGNIKKQNPDGSFKRTATGLPESPEFGGYNQRYFRSIVNEQGDRLRTRKLN